MTHIKNLPTPKPRDGSTADELFDQADKALLDAKRSGKNRIYLVGKP
jgi:PleD family two-component response regulator